MELQLSAEPSVWGDSPGKIVHILIHLHAQIDLELVL